jgi:hypothetical protein
VWAVPGALEQVLDNLLENALRFAPVGSSVELAVRQAEGWVELHVTDQGPGMPADQRERAFDRFWRGPASDREGTGLGLAIVRQLLEASGGTAELHPNPGGGLDAVAHLRPADHGSRIPAHRPTARPPPDTSTIDRARRPRLGADPTGPAGCYSRVELCAGFAEPMSGPRRLPVDWPTGCGRYGP